MALQLPDPRSIPSQDDLCDCGWQMGSEYYPRINAWIFLREDGRVSVTTGWQSTSGSGIQHNIKTYYGCVRTYRLRDGVQRKALVKGLRKHGDITKLLHRIDAGRSIVWGGSNYHGRLTDDAQAAERQLESMLGQMPAIIRVDRLIDDLFGDVDVLDELDLSVDATEEEVAQAVKSTKEYAKTFGSEIHGNVAKFLRDLIKHKKELLAELEQ